MKLLKLAACIGILAFLQGCKSYTSNIILKTEPADINWQAAYEKVVVENPIKPGDKIQFSLFTNEGESIIDPSGELLTAKSFGDGLTSAADKPVYEVLETGSCHFPLIGVLSVKGLKTSQLDSILSVKYEMYYNGVYVISKVVNKKITILGPKGGQIVPFVTNMNLLEAIAVYGGLDDKAKGYNIRVIRGDLKNPQITIVNLRTVSDMKNSIVNIQPDDIIYIEQVRRPATESVRDNLYVFNIIQILLTSIVLFRAF
jgi:polysaccharide export outer membrane protein